MNIKPLNSWLFGCFVATLSVTHSLNSLEASLATARQESSESGLTQTEVHPEACSILGSPLDFASSWRCGDVLIRCRKTFDSVNRNGPINERGVVIEEVWFRRVRFDLENQVCAVLDYSREEQLDLSKITADDDGIAVSILKRGVIVPKAQGEVLMRQFPMKLASQRLVGDGLNRTLFGQLCPEMRFMAYTESLGSEDEASLKKKVAKLAAGQNLLRSENNDTGARFVFDTPTNPAYEQSSRIEIQMDDRLLMPTERVHYEVFRDRATGNMAKSASNTSTFEWIEMGEIPIPKLVRCGNGAARRVGTELQFGFESREFAFHWFSFNQPFDPEWLNPDCLESMEAFMKLVDPEQAGAPELADFRFSTRK